MKTNATQTYIRAKDETGAAFASVRRNMLGLSADGAKLARAMSSVFGVSAGLAAFTRLTRSTIEAGSAITDAAVATRVGIEEYQVLKFAAQEAGAGMDKVTMSLAKIQKATNDARNGLTTYTRAFDALGIDLEKFQKLSPDRQFEALGKAMVGSKDKATAYASILDIIGSRSGPRLMEVLQRLGTEGFDEVARAAREAGQIMSGEVAKSMDEMADAMEEVETKLKNIWAGLVVGGANKTFALRTATVEIAALEMELEKLIKLKSKGKGLFKTIFTGGETADLYALKKLWFELGEAPDSYTDAIEVLQKRILELKKQRDGDIIDEDAVERAKKSVTDILTEIERLNNPSLGDLRKELDSAIVAVQAAFETGAPEAYEKALKYAGGAQKHLNSELDKTRRLKEEAFGILDSMSQEGNVSMDDVFSAMEPGSDSAAAYNAFSLEVYNSNEMMLHSMQRASAGMADAFVDFAMTGEASFKDMTKSILGDIVRMIIQMQILNPLLNGMFGTSPAPVSGVAGTRAAGGPVASGSTYLVGEKGPELFSPSRSGSIIPNNQLGAAPAGNVSITFRVDTYDSASFDQGIAQRRRMIVGMVDEALNKRGRRGVSQ